MKYSLILLISLFSFTSNASPYTIHCSGAMTDFDSFTRTYKKSIPDFSIAVDNMKVTIQYGETTIITSYATSKQTTPVLLTTEYSNQKSFFFDEQSAIDFVTIRENDIIVNFWHYGIVYDLIFKNCSGLN